jgi:branched-chain amino acid transport system ATP-binding protein
MLLDVRELEAGYGPIKALDGVSIAVEEGELVAIIGANGAGKTTLIRALAGMLPQARGTLLRTSRGPGPPPVCAARGRWTYARCIITPLEYVSSCQCPSRG